MAAMRDRKGQFKKGWNGMKPAGTKLAAKKKLAKRPAKTLNAPIDNVKTVGFGKGREEAPAGARVNVQMAAMRRGGAPGQVKAGGMMITKTQGDVTRGDRSVGIANIKLSKGQQQRLADRDAGILKGRQKKLAARAKPGESQEKKAQAVNNAKVMNASQMSPQQKIEAYQEMHGKAPSAAATAKLKAADAKGVRTPEARAARKEVTAARLAAGPEKPYSQVKAENAVARAQAALDDAKAKRMASGNLKARRPSDTELKRQGDLTLAKNKLADITGGAKEGPFGALKPAGKDQQTVASPSVPASSMTHDQALDRQKQAMAALESAKAARIARGGKSTSAEEKRLKAAFEDARKTRESIALKNANSQPFTGTIGGDSGFGPAKTKVINPNGPRSSSRKVGLGDLISDLAESKGLTASDLKPAGADQNKVVSPQAARTRREKLLVQKNRPLSFGNDYKKNRQFTARKEAFAKKAKVGKPDQWGDQQVTLNGRSMGKVRKRTEGAPVMNGRIRVGSMAAKGYSGTTIGGRSASGGNTLRATLENLSHMNDVDRRDRAVKKLGNMKSGVEARKAQRREAPKAAERLNAEIRSWQGSNDFNLGRGERDRRDSVRRQRNRAESLVNAKGNRERRRAGRRLKVQKIELRKSANADGTLNQHDSSPIIKLRDNKGFVNGTGPAFKKDEWGERESNGVKTVTSTNKKNGVVQVKTIPLYGPTTHKFYVSKKKYTKAQIAENRARFGR